MNIEFAAETYARLRARVVPDRSRIDDELIEGPMLMLEAVEILGDAIQVRDAAKNALAHAQAKALERWQDATGENGKPLNKEKLDAKVQLEPDVIEKTQELEDIKHACAYWQGLVEAFTERGSSLRRLSDLIVAGHMVPNAGGRTARETLEAARAAREKPQDDGVRSRRFRPSAA